MVVYAYGGGEIFAMAEGFGKYFSPHLPEPMRKLFCDPAFLDHQPVKDLLDEFADISALKAGLPLWLSVFPSNGVTEDVLDLAAAIVGVKSTRKSEFIKVQDLKDADIHNALLASAAIPLAYEAKMINNKSYRDGGVGGWWEVQGNTPATPLVENEFCTHLIVIHLQDGSLWNRRSYEGASIIEIRPSGIGKKGFIDMFAFERDSILRWMDQGYEDAIRCVDPIRAALKIMHKSDSSFARAISSVSEMENKLQWLDD